MDRMMQGSSFKRAGWLAAMILLAGCAIGPYPQPNNYFSHQKDHFYSSFEVSPKQIRDIRNLWVTVEYFPPRISEGSYLPSFWSSNIRFDVVNFSEEDEKILTKHIESCGSCYATLYHSSYLASNTPMIYVYVEGIGAKNFLDSIRTELAISLSDKSLGVYHAAFGDLPEKSGFNKRFNEQP